MNLRNLLGLSLICLLATLGSARRADAGACCLADGSCLDLPSEALCDILDGMYEGDATTCATVTCVPFGACCAPDLFCVIATAIECGISGGSYQGDGTACAPGICPVAGACCLPDGSCGDLVSFLQCAGAGGEYRGFLTDCATVDCRGACSFDDGTCDDDLTPDGCAGLGGNYAGNGSTCADVNAPSETQCQGFSFNQNDSTVLQFDQFDPMGGTRILQKATVNLDGAIHAVVILENLAAFPQDSFVSVVEFLEMLFPALQPGPLVAIDEMTVIACNPVVLPPGETCDFGSPLSFPGDAMGMASTPPGLAPFVGAGTIPATINAMGNFGFQGAQFILTQVPHRVEGIVKVRYEYVFAGACCFPDESCELLMEDECLAAGGEYRGDAVLCTAGLCSDDKGACCFGDGSCQFLPSGECVLAGGAPIGPGIDCDGVICVGACCFLDGSCDFLIADRCQIAAGEFQGHGIPCDPNPCPLPTGACCFPDGSCQQASITQCTIMGGSYSGTGTTCLPRNPCPPAVGACCFPNGGCTDLIEEDCDFQGGDWQDHPSRCATTKCPVGADCPADLDNSGDVGFTDLIAVLAAWGPCVCPEDLDHSGDVGFTDILTILAEWGPCP